MTVLTGAPRVGKSSVLYYLEYKKSIRIDCQTINSWDIGDHLFESRTDKNTRFLIISEVDFTEQFMNALVNFLENQDRLNCKVVLDIPIENFDTFRNKAGSLAYGCVIYPIIPYQEMVEYVSELTNSEIDDPMVTLIAKLSGGCLMILHGVIDQFKYYRGEFDLDGFLDWLKQVKKSLGMNFTVWNEIRGDIPDDLKPYVPDPALGRIDFYELKRSLL